MKLKKLLLILTVLSFIFLQSCKKETPENEQLSNPKLYTEYISSFTSGVIPTNSPIDIVLTKNWGNWETNQELEENLFTISPKVNGKLYFLAPSNTIRFEPNEKLVQDQRYIVTLKLKDIIQSDETLDNFTFQLNTIPLSFHIDFLDLQSTKSNEYLVNAVLSSTDFVKKKQIEKIISAYTDDEKVEIQLTGDNDIETKEFPFIVKNIDNTSSILTAKIDGKPIDINQKIEFIYNLPTEGGFAAFNIKTFIGDDQTFWVNFNYPIKKNQNFDGLITVSDSSAKLTYTTDGNVLKVYSDKPFNNEAEVIVHSGIKGMNGTSTLSTTYNKSFFVNFGIQKPAVELLSNGTILPSSQNLKINFKATTLNAVDVKVYRIYENNVLQFLQDNGLSGSYYLKKVASPIAQKTINLTNPNKKALLNWNTYALDLSELIKPEPGAIYRVEFSMKKAYSLYNCPDNGDGETEEEFNDSEYYEDDDYGDYYYYYDWSERKNPCNESYYYYQGKKATNVLATDLGVIVKGGSNNVYTTIVTNLITTEPIGDATVEFYTYQQQLIASAKTNSSGLLNINLENQTPAFAVVKYNKNTTYVNIENKNALSVSNFDVDGTEYSKGLNGYVYTERGVWRPGDNIYLGFILDDTAKPLPTNHPIKLSFFDPYGKLVDQIVQKKNNINHYIFQLKTTDESPTGNWSAQINIGGVKFNKTIKVETIKPNRLKIKNNVDGKTISSRTNSRVDFNVQWLQGGIARDLQASVNMKLIKQPTTFSKFKSYTFDNNLYSDYSQDQTLFNGQTNDSGNFSFDLNLKQSFTNAGLLKAVFVTKVHEKGGDVSTDVSTATYSPFSSYVGIKAPEPNKYGYYETDKKLSFKLIKINDQQETLEGRINVKVYRTKGSWWWSEGGNGYSNYSTSSYYSLYASEIVSTNTNGTAEYTITIPEQDWGRYEIVATDDSSQHIAATSVYVDWPYYMSRSKGNEAKDAIMLAISTDKKDYNTGETVKISFPSSEGGRALISVENGTNIIETHWVKTTKGETSFELTTKPSMAPNAYISITSIQPHANTLNDSPIRLYGIAPINVFNKKTKLEPVITMPETLRPNTEFNVQIKEKNGQKMTYSIAVVEEGLLDLTRFKTPNPWDKFYSKTALGIRTWDIYNDVIGAYGGSINQVFSIGGDEDLGAGQVKKANRFKPVVLFEGPFELEAGKTVNHKLKMPKYIGSVRTMIIAANTETKAYGSAEKATKVNNPLMILGSLPRRAVPGEKITLPVTVFAMEKHIKDVKVKVITDDKFNILSSNTQNVNFSKPEEKVLYFDLDVLQKTGISKVTIEATSGKEKVTYEIELDVLNPNPVTTVNYAATILPGQSSKIKWDSFGIQNSNGAVLELSNFPSINLTSRLKYLISYPHGCSEQVTSGVFPQLYLADFTPLDDSKKASTQRNINAGIAMLAQRQLPNGGFRYWSSSSYAGDWVTSYIGHFFIEAEKKGYALPVNSKANWIAYQQREAREWRQNTRYSNDLAQAYRLYTLALANAPEVAAMNRLRETKGLSNQAQLRLAATYALIGQKDAANKLISTTKTDSSENDTYYYYGSYERNMAMELETLLSTGTDTNLTNDLAIKLANRLGSDTWMSTQTTAYSLNVISKYLQKNKVASTIRTEYNFNGKDNTLTSKSNIANVNLAVKPNNEISITNKEEGTLYAKVAVSGILPIGKELTEESKLDIRIGFTNTNDVPINPSTIRQGTEFAAYITITNNSGQSIENVALTQIIPSGWEIVNLRFTEAGGENNQVDHTDIRDDRTQFYFFLKARESKTFKVTLNASYIGKYYMPGIYADAMYDNTYRCRKAGQWIEVTP
ncbi:MG2 domain-containing protein [Myroides pelagicus]|uniref:alpha-2-macroglobulin family protein n=1 Tax=Myroides pelagicus TaxID=270914 RepID=UPI002DBB577D|nr:MG2 domain-containing protein [Myroides pelagicus]MEC4112811.1 MG2 domain-containing protein [Myroides pelagicus]